MKSLDYQESTKRSWERIRANPHSLDFANMPQIYSDVARHPLSTDLPDSAVPTLAALAEPGAHAGDDRAPGRNELARLLSAVGITKRRRYPGGEIPRPFFVLLALFASWAAGAMVWSAKHASGRQDPLRVVSASGRGRVLV